MENQETLQAADEAVMDSDSAPEETQTLEAEDAQEAAPEEKPEQPEPEEKPGWQKAIDKQTYYRREAERQLAEAQDEIDKLKARVPQDVAPEIPPIPDAFDEDHDQKVIERDKAIKARAEWDTRQALKAAVQQREEQRQAQEAQEALMKRGAIYQQRSTQMGVNAQELASAGQFVASYINPQVADYILDSEQGPLITMHLARNPGELERVSSMPPMMAAVHIATQIEPNVTAKPTVTKAPAPPETLDGGAPPSERGPKGATYE